MDNLIQSSLQPDKVALFFSFIFKVKKPRLRKVKYTASKCFIFFPGLSDSRAFTYDPSTMLPHHLVKFEELATGADNPGLEE